MENQVKLHRKLTDLSGYISDNGLVINETKTKIKETMIRQKRCKLKDVSPELNIQLQMDSKL